MHSLTAYYGNVGSISPSTLLCLPPHQVDFSARFCPIFRVTELWAGRMAMGRQAKFSHFIPSLGILEELEQQIGLLGGLG